MTAPRFDIAIVGAGLNGLVTAAYLAKAGRSVIVFERSDNLGGTSSLVEIAPGFRGPAAVDSHDLFHPSIVTELRLTDHGLATRERNSLLVPKDDGPALFVGGNERFAEFDLFVRHVSRSLDPLLARPLYDPGAERFAGVSQMAAAGWRLRRNGAASMAEAMRLLPMNVKDLLDERLEDETLKAALAGSALRGAWMGPRSAGSAFALLRNNPDWAGGLAPRLVFAENVDSGFSEALARAARAAGAKIQTGTPVDRIVVDDGRATGVGLSDGSLVASRVVVSAVDPKKTLLELAGTKWLDPEFVELVGHIRGRGGVTVIRLALDGLPTFAGVTDPERQLAGRIQIGSTMDGLERAHDAAKYGLVPERPFITASIPSLSTSGLAPDGKHVMIVWAQSTPKMLNGSNWGAEREAFADRVVTILDRHAPGLEGSVLRRQIETPLELEQRFGLTDGCLDHVEQALDQLLYMRPMPGWYNHETPVQGLYLSGPGTHPGGLGTGLSGKCAAVRVLKDWSSAS